MIPSAPQANWENNPNMSLPTVFVNLVVEDVAKTREFFSALGFEFDPMCSGDQTVCVILAEGVRAMLMDSAFFQAFTSKTLADARESTEAVIALDVGGRERVDDILARAVAAGGRESREPRDHGFMYGRGFEDPDGHLWEVYHMSGG